MQANETKLKDILEGTKQYVIPLFQRTYNWDKKQWEILWKDLIELYGKTNPRPHFFGSIVSMQTTSVPEGVSKFLLIDGQQRLTTIFILLTLMRDKAKQEKIEELASEINDTFLVNKYNEDKNNYFKLMPTQVDRNDYKNLISEDHTGHENKLIEAYTFFEKKLRQVKPDLKMLKKIVINYFSIVSIVLDSNDDPYLVFEGLNAKGLPLTQADLIRNYFFMCINVDEQENIYKDYWLPMEERLSNKLTEYIRHFLMMDGSILNLNDVYYALKEKVSQENATAYIKNLEKYSVYYQRLINPKCEPEEKLKKYFDRLNNIEVTTAYPLLLNFYNDYKEEKITKDQFIEILKILENYLIRRFVCNVPTNQLNKIFPSIYPKIIEKYLGNTLEGIKFLLQERNYPKDEEFSVRFNEAKFYGAADRNVKTKLILETIEESFSHKEQPEFDSLTIEHVMPRTLTEWWQNHLGNDFEETHELFLDTIGNLTLTAYNSELSNAEFPYKKEIYTDSHLELNKYFSNISSWTRTKIEERTKDLTNKAISIWSYFGKESPVLFGSKQVTGTIPIEVSILGQQFKTKTWRDVLEQTLNTITDLEPDKFEIIASSFHKYIGKDKSNFREIRSLRNGYFFEVNLNAELIQKLCYQLIQAIGLTSEDWIVRVN
ncbi:MAG: DUF262 domain-containing protein [bacterium]